MILSGTAFPASPTTGDLFIFTSDTGAFHRGEIYRFGGTDWENISRETQEINSFVSGLNTGVPVEASVFLFHNGTTLQAVTLGGLETYLQANLNFAAGLVTQADIDAAVAAEVTARSDADSALSNRITDEVTARREADNTLSARIDAIDTSVGEANVQSDWNQTDDTQDDYIQNKPGIAQADWDELDDTDPAYIRNKPTSLGGGGGGLTQDQVDVRVSLGVADWAETGNTDIIPSSKLPAAVQQRTDDAVRNLARETVADWAETNNTDRAPLGKMTAGIVIDAQPEVDSGRIRLRLTRTGGTGQSVANTVWVDLPTGGGTATGVDYDLGDRPTTDTAFDSETTNGLKNARMPLATLYGSGFTGSINGVLSIYESGDDHVQQVFIPETAAVVAVRVYDGSTWSDWSVNAPWEDDITGISISGSTITATRRNGDTVEIALPEARPASPVLTQWAGATDPRTAVLFGQTGTAGSGGLASPYDAANDRWILQNGNSGQAGYRYLGFADDSVNWDRFMACMDLQMAGGTSPNYAEAGFYFGTVNVFGNISIPTGHGYMLHLGQKIVSGQRFFNVILYASVAPGTNWVMNSNATLADGVITEGTIHLRIPVPEDVWRARNRWILVRNGREIRCYLNNELKITWALPANQSGRASGDDKFGFGVNDTLAGEVYLHGYLIGFPSIEMLDPMCGIDGADIVDVGIDSPQNFNLQLTRKGGATKTVDLGEVVTNVSLSGSTLTISKKGTSATSTALTLPSGGGGSGEENVQSDWNVTDTASDAFIRNKPTIPPAQVPSDWNATSGVARILNKPDLVSAAAGELTTAVTGSTTIDDWVNTGVIPDTNSDYILLDVDEITLGVTEHVRTLILKTTTFYAATVNDNLVLTEPSSSLSAVLIRRNSSNEIEVRSSAASITYSLQTIKFGTGSGISESDAQALIADWAEEGNTNAIPRTKITDASILRMENLEYDPNNHELTIIQRRADGGLNEPTIDLSALAGGGGGSSAWADITGKPNVVTDISDPTTVLPRNLTVSKDGQDDEIIRLARFGLYRGDWSSSTGYQYGDMVKDAGFLFLCIGTTVSPTTNHPAHDTSNWELMNYHSGQLWDGNIVFTDASHTDANTSSAVPSHIGAIQTPDLRWRDMGGFKQATKLCIEISSAQWGNHWFSFDGMMAGISEGNNLSYFDTKGQYSSGSVMVLWARISNDTGSLFRLNFHIYGNGSGGDYRLRRISHY